MSKDLPSAGNQGNDDGTERQSRTTKPKLSNGIFYFGLVLTIAWLLTVTVWWSGEINSLRELDPNEFGDFLGGTVAPIAFLWLVLGFWQQGRELRNSADALWLQMEELRNSVEQQRDLVGATRDLRATELDLHEARLAEERRAAQPMLTIEGGGGNRQGGTDSYSYRFTVSNAGRPCNEVKVTIGNTLLRRVSRMESADQNDFTIEASFDEETAHRCEVSWIDERNHPGRRVFEITTGPGRERTIQLIKA